ncbi:MAG: DmsC/YnfH family molybdoenzyme membrane anchor subunit [Acidimicrobiales bacterium]
MTLVTEPVSPEPARTSAPIAFTPTRRRPVHGVTERGPDLLALQAGEQYRFSFAMDACVGCHSCEVACAEQNDTPVDQAWRRVGELEGGSFPDTRRFSLSMACNHCVEPTCLSGCPSNAYEKLANGIVAHHPDDCIGCQYCIWNCPYEVPVFNPVNKIVSKCDMCRPRIDEGQSPACVLACPTHAIGVEKVDVVAWRADHAAADAPGLPPSDITLSTTRIARPPDMPAGTTAANEHRVRPEDPHWPLVVLTLLTQLSLGTVATTVALEVGGATLARAGGRGLAGPAVGAFLAGLIALTASLLHLGRPSRALKALRNLRTSWLSREVALFSGFSFLSFGYATAWAAGSTEGGPSTLVLGAAAVMVGIAGVYASARLYRVPARPVWNSPRTPVAFFATAVSTGPLVGLLSLDRSTMRPGWVAAMIVVAAMGTVAQIAVQARLSSVVRRRTDKQHRGTATLLGGELHGLFRGRLFSALLGLALLVSATTVPLGGAACGGRLGVALLVIAVGELAGRYLFYVSVVPYRMADGFFGSR